MKPAPLIIVTMFLFEERCVAYILAIVLLHGRFNILFAIVLYFSFCFVIVCDP